MKNIKIAGKLAGIFSSSTVIIVGSIVLLRSMSLDFDSVLYACKLSITSAIVAGFLGYFMGKTFEKANMKAAKHGKSNKSSGLLIDDILDNDLDKLDLGEDSNQTST